MHDAPPVRDVERSRDAPDQILARFERESGPRARERARRGPRRRVSLHGERKALAAVRCLAAVGDVRHVEMPGCSRSRRGGAPRGRSAPRPSGPAPSWCISLRATRPPRVTIARAKYGRPCRRCRLGARSRKRLANRAPCSSVDDRLGLSRAREMVRRTVAPRDPESSSPGVMRSLVGVPCARGSHGPTAPPPSPPPSPPPPPRPAPCRRDPPQLHARPVGRQLVGGAPALGRGGARDEDPALPPPRPILPDARKPFPMPWGSALVGPCFLQGRSLPARCPGVGMP